MAKPFSYSANTEAAAEVYDNSLFKSLFKQRNTLLLDKTFPRAEKGLALPELSQKIGAATYSFKLSGDSDKVSIKTKDSEWTAEYKKDAKNFDLTMKSKVMDGMSGMVKYEARGSGVTYTVGGGYTVKGLPVIADIDFDFEASPFTKNIVASALWVSPFVAGLTIAGDCSMAKMDPSSMQFNAGALWKGPIGSVNASYSNKTNFATVSVFNDSLMKGFCVAGEMTMAVPGMKAGTPKCPMSVGCGYKIDAEHTIKARVNQDLGAQLMLEKELAKGSSILIGSAVSLKDPMAVMPWNASFGVKLVCK